MPQPPQARGAPLALLDGAEGTIYFGPKDGLLPLTPMRLGSLRGTRATHSFREVLRTGHSRAGATPSPMAAPARNGPGQPARGPVPRSRDPRISWSAASTEVSPIRTIHQPDCSPALTTLPYRSAESCPSAG